MRVVDHLSPYPMAFDNMANRFKITAHGLESSRKFIDFSKGVTVECAIADIERLIQFYEGRNKRSFVRGHSKGVSHNYNKISQLKKNWLLIKHLENK